jgi:hypothetical protein
LALGLPLYVFARPFARIADLAGDDLYIYNLGGAAMIGYAIALALGMRGGLWSPMRFVVLATYVFAGIAFLAGFVSFASNQINGFVVVFSLWAVVVAWVLAQILVARRGAIAGPRNVATWAAVVLPGPAIPRALRIAHGLQRDGRLRLPARRRGVLRLCGYWHPGASFAELG